MIDAQTITPTSVDAVPVAPELSAFIKPAAAPDTQPSEPAAGPVDVAARVPAATTSAIADGPVDGDARAASSTEKPVVVTPVNTERVWLGSEAEWLEETALAMEHAIVHAFGDLLKRGMDVPSQVIAEIKQNAVRSYHALRG